MFQDLPVFEFPVNIQPMLQSSLEILPRIHGQRHVSQISS